MSIQAVPSAPTELRETGIPLVGPTAWGSHICVFYETTDDLLETGTSFFKAGLEANEFCVWTLPGAFLQAKAIEVLKRDVPHAERYLASGQIVIADGYTRYLDQGAFVLEKVMNGWQTQLEVAISKGHDGLRASSEAFWTQTPYWKKNSAITSATSTRRCSTSR
jgi:hypothetical protein